MVRKLKKPNTGGSANSQQDIIRQAQVMQQEMLKIQEGLKDKFVETSVAGGAITAKANGQKEIVDLILTEGFKPSDSGRSMGSGVYFTTAMKNGDSNNNPYAIAKSRGYGKYTIISIVMIHDGIKKINSSASLFTEDAQNWPSNIDVKYMPPGVKVYDKNNVEYGGENVIKDPEKIIPLGYVYKKDSSDDDSD